MSKHTILATAPIEKVAVDILAEFGELVIAPDQGKNLFPYLDGAIALIVRGEAEVGADVIEAGKDLRVIARSGAGYNNVDIAAATRRGIPVVYTPGANSRAVAEAAVTFLLASTKRLFFWDTQLKNGNWKSRFESKPGDVEGQTIGLIGLGSIGQTVAHLLQPFDAKLLAYDPYVNPDKAKALNVSLVSLEELLKQSQSIVILAALTEQTKGMINRKNLQLVQPGAHLLNISRGGLIESLDVLYEALQSGRLGAVALDVFEPEPPDIHHPIFKHPNCIATPHALGMTPGAMERIFRLMAEDIASILRGQKPRSVVNPEVLK